MNSNHTMIFKTIYFILLVPTCVLTLEKVRLTHYPRLATILSNNNNSSIQTDLINQYLGISQNNNSQTFTYSEYQQSYITAGLYLLFHAKNVENEQNQCILEANQSFNQAFKYPKTFNINADTPIGNVCSAIENALWWDYYLSKIPFIKGMLHFIYQIRNNNKSHYF